MYILAKLFSSADIRSANTFSFHPASLFRVIRFQENTLFCHFQSIDELKGKELSSLPALPIFSGDTARGTCTPLALLLAA